MDGTGKFYAKSSILNNDEITIDDSYAITIKRNIAAGYGPTTICV
jgi:hypothetical protein